MKVDKRRGVGSDGGKGGNVSAVGGVNEAMVGQEQSNAGYSYRRKDSDR